MPRPTAAQLAYGSATVVCTTLAMLLLSQTSSGVGVAVIALAALGLGLLVAVTVPMPRPAQSQPAEASAERIPQQRTTPDATTPRRIRVEAEAVREPVRGPAGR